MRGYKIVMMNKHEIRIDAEELPKVIQAIQSTRPAILKQGIFNPNSYSHIIEDESRKSVDRERSEFGHYTGGYSIKFEELPDIFKGIKEVAQLKGEEVKKLT